MEEARRIVRQVLEQEPEHPEAQDLALLIEEAETRRAQEAEAARKAARSLNRWRLFSLTAAGLFLVVLVMVVWQPFPGLFSSSFPLPDNNLRHPQPKDASLSPPLVFVDPKFPLISLTRDQEGVRMSGEVQTMPELLHFLKQTSKVHTLNLDVVKVKYEHSFPYRVRHRDTLISLAHRFYGQKSKWKLIQEANPTVVKDPDLIRPGEQLLIPGPPKTQDAMSPDQDIRE